MHNEELDISSILKSLVAELRADKPRHNVAVAIKENMFACADARLIQVALSNLLGNAWKFTSRTAQPKIECGSMVQEGTAVYFMKDNGAGFDQTFAHRMFLPFHRLHPEEEFEGTGIGLAIVERVIRRHGGKIWAEGRKNEGATFFFTLPRQGEKE
jgi:light-regulated signal transduction histidine kinase (bacteriophytochrome)